jgi:hypothetical protein
MKKCAEDAVKNGGVGAVEDSWWLQTGGSGRGGKGSERGLRSPRVELAGGFEHMDSTSIQMLADLVAAAPVTGGDTGSDSQYSLHREHRREESHREHRRSSSSGAPMGDHAGKYSPSMSSQGSSGNTFHPDGVGQSARRGGGGSSSSECSSRGSSGGGVSISGMSAPRKDQHHVHREWRDIIGDGSHPHAHARGRSGAEKDGKRDGGGLQSSSNEESGPTDGSSTHGNGTSNGSGNDSGSSNRSIRSSNHSSGAVDVLFAGRRATQFVIVAVDQEGRSCFTCKLLEMLLEWV